MDQYKGSKCWAGSIISSRISRYINLKLIFSIVFVCHTDVHIPLFPIYTKLSKTMAFEKSVLSIVAYGLHLTCVTSVAFTIRARHVHGLFVIKCITMCSDMNINISNTDSFTQTIYLWYEYNSKWICVSFSFQYIWYCLKAVVLHLYLPWGTVNCVCYMLPIFSYRMFARIIWTWL